MAEKSISLLLLLVWVMPFKAIAEEQHVTVSEQELAILHATRDAQQYNESVWVFAGFFLNIVGIVGANLVTPTVPSTKLLGKSPEYVDYYTKTYQQEVRRKRTEQATLGCTAGALCLGISYAHFFGPYCLSIPQY